ncbi:purine-nucleoside phosphorylase [Actinotalea sp. BY-33]|uniref:Uridine phosphorylase n=1 Tax=Actinotalea soli TaxID=2819234 RepID=A0A939RUI4_9CELL|nr:purine-nucleoside phosphorylase [Actinotalea soli]MBO1751375.1 purine-nucleoside phosphorylase [Actinotalea soli]
MATPHIDAAPGDFAPDILMPGDPRRATRIAETVLEDARLVTEVRGILGYTGTFDGRPVSVLASGMGVPSISIYATELFREFGAQRIVRIGTAGGMAPHLQVGDVVIASAAHTDSGLSANRVPGVHYSHAPSFSLLAAAATAAGAGKRDASGRARAKDSGSRAQAAGSGASGTTIATVTKGSSGAAGTEPTPSRRRRRGKTSKAYVGPVFTSDAFYADRPQTMEALVAHGTLAVEMEAAGLYATADAEGGQALAICTISDLLFSDASLSAAERELLFDRSVAYGLAAFAAG